MPEQPNAANRIALVTGGARRIGRALCLALAHHGWTVAVHYNTSGAAAKDLVREIEAVGANAIALHADLSNESAVAGLIPQVVALDGSFDLLINNAAHFRRDTFATMTRATWDAHLETNLRAPVVLTQQFAAQRVSAAVGVVINLLDHTVWNPPSDFISYTISKSALWMLTRTAAMALAPGVRVNAIGPGPTLQGERQSQAHFDAMVAGAPLGRTTTPQEIFIAIQYILDTPSITGQMIALDGGQHLARESR